MTGHKRPAAWKVLGSRRVFEAAPFIAVDRLRVRLPDGRLVPDYHRIELPSFAIVVARDDRDRVLMVDQYRQGIGRASLGLPAGQLEPGERPLGAARRELHEETGYRARRWKPLGQFRMNSNYGCGSAHIFAASGLRRVAAPSNPDLEETVPVFLTDRQVDAALRRDIGAISVAAALGLERLRRTES